MTVLEVRSACRHSGRVALAVCGRSGPRIPAWGSTFCYNVQWFMTSLSEPSRKVMFTCASCKQRTPQVSKTSTEASYLRPCSTSHQWQICIKLPPSWSIIVLTIGSRNFEDACPGKACFSRCIFAGHDRASHQLRRDDPSPLELYKLQRAGSPGTSTVCRYLIQR